VWELPGTVHQGRSIATRIMLLARSGALASMLEERLFAPDIARCRPGRSPAGARERLRSWAADKLTYYL
jgi:hypothetical protein